jgi:feruloyl esterase
MNHCAGGPATDSFDGLGAIVDWVEKGTAPVRIAASALPARSTSPVGRVRCVRIRLRLATRARVASRMA